MHRCSLSSSYHNQLLCILYAILFAIASSNLGIIAYLLALIYGPQNEEQVYVLVSQQPKVVLPVSIVPGWVLVGSYWFTLAVSVVSVIDLALLLFILLRQRHRLQHQQAPTTSNHGKHPSDPKKSHLRFDQAWISRDVPFLSALTLIFFTVLNIIIGTTALCWLIHQDRGIPSSDSDLGDSLDVTTSREGQYLQYDGSAGYTIGAFSCALLNANVEAENIDLRGICRTGKTPSRLLIAYVVLQSLAFILMLLPRVVLQSLDPKQTSATSTMVEDATSGIESETKSVTRASQA